MRLSKIFTDFGFEGDAGEGGSLSMGQCATLRAAHAHVAAGAPTYVFQYDYHTDIMGRPAQLVQHTDEVPFIFESLNVTKRPSAARVAHLLGSYWSAFIATRTPNKNSKHVFWPEFGATGRLLRFPGGHPFAELPSRRHFCHFWQK